MNDLTNYTTGTIDSSTANFLHTEFGLDSTSTSWHFYGCLCDLCTGRFYQPYQPIYTTRVVVHQTDADAIEAKAAEKVIEAIRKQKNLSQEAKDALQILDGIRKLRGK